MLSFEGLKKSFKEDIVRLIILINDSDERGRQIIGCVMAFASGLFFTSNSFVIKGTGLSFGEVNAVRSIIQILLMICIILVKSKFINLYL